MELDELKGYRSILKAPAEGPGFMTGSSQSTLDSLIDTLKAEDAKQLAALKRAKPLWWIAAVLWAVSCVASLAAYLSADQQFGSGFPLRGILALIFSGLAVGLYIQIKRTSAIDYAEPSLAFLQKAAKRYRFISTPSLVVSLLLTAVLALAASSYIVDVFERYLGVQNPSVGILSTFAFVAIVYSFGFVVSKKAWSRARGQFLEEIRKMRDDLSSESV